MHFASPNFGLRTPHGILYAKAALTSRRDESGLKQRLQARERTITPIFSGAILHTLARFRPDRNLSALPTRHNELLRNLLQPDAQVHV
jgi:hypothetical protein